MKTYLIGYDLNRPRGADDYPDLINVIKQFGTWWHGLDSTWIVKSNNSSVEIRNSIKAVIDTTDEVLVVALNGEGAWAGFGTKLSAWLKDNL